MCPKGAQFKLQSERCVPKILKLSFEVSECKPLPQVCLTDDGDAQRHRALVLLGRQLDAVQQGFTLVHFSAQPGPFLTPNTPQTPPSTP
jgi:hypothetical protein